MKLLFFKLLKPLGMFAIVFLLLLPNSFADGAINGSEISGGAFVVPHELENVEGLSRAQFMEGRWQQIVRSPAFSDLPASYVWLTNMSFRVDVFPSGQQSGTAELFFDHVEVTLSSNPRAVPRWFYDHGSDKTVVLSSSVTLAYTAPKLPDPAPFNMNLNFEKPFLYKEGASILMDINISGRKAFDADFTESPHMDRLEEFFVGTITTIHGGWVLQFGYAIPEPETYILGSLSVVILAAFKRKMK